MARTGRSTGKGLLHIGGGGDVGGGGAIGGNPAGVMVTTPFVMSIREDAAVGDLVGTLAVLYTSGTPSFTLVDSAGGRFALDGVGIEVNGALDYETNTSHLITVSVSGVTPPISNTSFVIAVTNVAEGGEYTPGADFSDQRNSQYVAVLLDDPF